MLSRLKWSSVASVALIVSACAEPTQSGLFNPGSGGSDSANAGADEAGASRCAGVGAAGASAAGTNCNAASGGAAGSVGISGAAAGASGAIVGGATSSAGLVGGAMSNAGVVGGSAGNAGGAGSGGASLAGANSGGTSGKGGGGNSTGGALGKCELMKVQADAQLQGAQTCSTATGEAFCTGYAENECGCMLPVNKAESIATENYVKARDAFMKACPVTCSTPCVEPKSQTCQLIFGLVVGSCVAM